ncbi:MAG: cytochrome c biogenesis CcdA family protein [Candidatus Gastranaerophilales bacterium]|nr:cytochrome c biogenesis CcdA family protein [Candidatus Gastranaerophilales bacterium]
MNIIFGSIFLIFASFLGGLITSVSPCTIGILPLILAYVCGTNKSSNKEITIKLLSFSAGLSFVLGIIGIICAATGQVFGGLNSPVLLLLFGSIMMILGLQLVGVLDLQIPVIVKKFPQNTSTGLFWYPFIIGILFAFISSPCSSPVLAGIMALAVAKTDFVTSFLMLFAFAFGQCIIIILAGLFASFLKNLQKIQKYTDILIKLSGLIFIAFAIVIWISVYKNLLSY